MPFSNTVREAALVAARRRCCVCQNFKGRNVEVHHIIPSHDGGSDDFDNAIVLCFDCHAEAGHYNPRHPRGTRYSHSELRRHRDNWYNKVKQSNIQPFEGANLHYNYLICQSTDIISEIAQKQLQHFPISQTLLAETSVLYFHQWLSRLERSGRLDHNISLAYHSLKNFESNHANRPNERISPSDSGHFHEWNPSEQEIATFVSPRNQLVSELLRSGADPADITQAGALLDTAACDDSPITVFYRLREIWSCYLIVTNTTNESIRFRRLHCSTDEPTHVSLRNFNAGTENGPTQIDLPSGLVRPRQSIIVPLFTFMPPWEHPNHDWPFIDEYLPNGQGQIVARGHCEWLSTRSHLIGPSIWPNRIDWEQSARDESQLLTNIDINNIYSIDRYWGAGCCPHAFFLDSTGKLRYSGEIFTKGQGCPVSEDVAIPSDATTLIIAELEHETTTLLKIGEYSLEPPLHLRKGEHITIPLTTQSIISLVGMYSILPSQSAKIIDPWTRRVLVREFLARWPTPGAKTIEIDPSEKLGHISVTHSHHSP